MTLPAHPHTDHAILCSCPACCASRLTSARRVFTAQGDASQVETKYLAGDYDFVDSRQRFELGE